MRSNVYIAQHVPQQHDPRGAFVKVVLAGFPENIDSHTFFETNISVTRQQTAISSLQDLVLSGTTLAIRETVDRWPESLENWRRAVKNALKQVEQGEPDKPLKVGKWRLPWHRRTLVMGILNVTPDSFSDGGDYDTVEAAVAHAHKLVEAGADILDIGGESTRPAGVYGEGAAFVSAEVEKKRVLPVISRLAKEVDVPLSIDTYKAEVAEAAILSGAHIINDVWGLKRDPQMAEIVARYGVPVIIMHNRERINYSGPLMQEIIDDLRESVMLAHTAGVSDAHIILDPGIGFAKTYEHSIDVMRHLEQITYMGYPVLLGTSRKSIIGHALGLPVDERVEGTGATLSFGIAKGCRIVRVHDVKEMVRVCRMCDALARPSSVVV